MMARVNEAMHLRRIGPFVVLVAVLATAARGASDCTQTSVGLIPLPDLGAKLYLGHEGGLYPGGSNQLPAAHLDAGRLRAAAVQPLDASGQPDPAGLVGLLSVGMSNASEEYLAFLALAVADPEVRATVRVINGAENLRHAADLANPGSSYWSGTLPQRLAQAGVDRQQVQVVWLKTAQFIPQDPFPLDAQLSRLYLQAIVQHLLVHLPRLQLVFLSSRTYAGYESIGISPEPFAYEEGFAVKWLIEDQIAGNPALNFDAGAGPVRAPWLAWGPYLWADGLVARSDGWTYACSDFHTDGTHPSASGEFKIGARLLHFFKTDELTRDWFLAQPAACPGPARVELYGCATPGVLGLPRIHTDALPDYQHAGLTIEVNGVSPSSVGAFFLGVAKLAEGAAPIGGGALLVDPRWILLRTTTAAGSVQLTGFPLHGDPTFCGATFYTQFIVLDSASADGAYAQSAGLAATIGR